MNVFDLAAYVVGAFTSAVVVVGVALWVFFVIDSWRESRRGHKFAEDEHAIGLPPPWTRKR